MRGASRATQHEGQREPLLLEGVRQRGLEPGDQLVEQALGPVDELAGLEALDHVGDLGLEGDDQRVAGQRDLDRGQQVGRGERLHHVGEGTGLARLLDELLLAERRSCC